MLEFTMKSQKIINLNRLGDQMKIDIFQHIASEGPAAIGDWAEKNGDTLTIHKFYENEPVPSGHDLDFLVVLGGPMSVNDQDKPWIAEERRCISEALAADVPVFGICLGAQQLAKTLGAEVIAGVKEVGWYPITKTTRRLPCIPAVLTPLHWHGETFALPQGAERLFSSEACSNQGFIFRNKAIGLQFHLEATKESVATLLACDGAYLDQSPYVQSAEQIAAFTVPEENHKTLFQLLDGLRDPK
ncbi:MAG: type 1 glutamine amidotransferase [Sporolactobacillus sp.]